MASWRAASWRVASWRATRAAGARARGAGAKSRLTPEPRRLRVRQRAARALREGESEGADCQCLVVHDSPSTLAVTAPADHRVEESVSSAAALHHVTEETCGIHTSGVSWQVREWARRSTRWAGSDARRTLRLAATVAKIEREDPASPRSAEARMVEDVVRPRRGLVAAHTPKMRRSHRALERRHLVGQVVRTVSQ